MKQKNINGFEENQIFQLYAFLVAYEESGIEKYKSTKSLLNDHPELVDIEKVAKPVIRHGASNQKMKVIDFKVLTNEVYLTKDKGNLLLSFLAHLRNSIAHGNAVERQGRVLVTDYANPKYNPINFTARGCIDFDVINSITKVLKQIVL